MLSRKAVVMVLAVLLLPGSALAQITNGGFAPGSPVASYVALGGGSTAIPGWVTTDSGVEWFDPVPFSVTVSPEGGYVVDLANTSFSAGGIRQTFVTVPGQLYGIVFYYATQMSSGRDGTAEIVVTADASSQTFPIVNLSSIAVWESRTFTFLADDASATLHFRCLQDARFHFAFIDGVGAGAPVPVAKQTWGSIKALYR